jgi:hypothetical protein
LSTNFSCQAHKPHFPANKRKPGCQATAPGARHGGTPCNKQTPQGSPPLTPLAHGLGIRPAQVYFCLATALPAPAWFWSLHVGPPHSTATLAHASQRRASMNLASLLCCGTFSTSWLLARTRHGTRVMEKPGRMWREHVEDSLFLQSQHGRRSGWPWGNRQVGKSVCEFGDGPKLVELRPRWVGLQLARCAS